MTHGVSHTMLSWSLFGENNAIPVHEKLGVQHASVKFVCTTTEILKHELMMVAHEHAAAQHSSDRYSLISILLVYFLLSAIYTWAYVKYRSCINSGDPRQNIPTELIRPEASPWTTILWVFCCGNYCVYIPPDANIPTALGHFLSAKIKQAHLDGMFAIAGDFIRANMKTVFPKSAHPLSTIGNKTGLRLQQELCMGTGHTSASPGTVRPHITVYDSSVQTSCQHGQTSC